MRTRHAFKLHLPAWAGGAALAAVVCVTRLPLLSAWPGEPDSAWFVLGGRQWSRFGASAPQVYDRVFSPGYYWLAARLNAGSQDIVQLSWRLNLFSLAAALLTAWFIWELGKRLTLPAAAFWSGIVFLLGPAVWWLGLEPHPQGPAMALFLAAMLSFVAAYPQPRTAAAAARFPLVRYRYLWLLASLLLLAASLLLRADGVLALLIFPVLAARSRSRQPGQIYGEDSGVRPSGGDSDARRHRVWAWLRRSREGWLLGAAASLLFFFGRAALLHTSWRQSQSQSWRAIAGYLGRVNWGKQLLPVLTAPGVLVWPAILAGLLYGLRRRGRTWAAHWLPPALAFSLPPYVFWLLVRGNNCRHVALYSLIWLWPAAEAGGGWGRRRLPALAAALLALNFLIIPASSNLTLYPSGNVFSSARRLHRRERQIAQLTTRWLDRAAFAPAPACYLGAATTPYVLWSISRQAPARFWLTGRGAGDVHARLRWAVPTHPVLHLWFPGVYSRRGLRRYASACPDWFSLEFTPNGRRRYFLARRLHALMAVHRGHWLWIWRTRRGF